MDPLIGYSVVTLGRKTAGNIVTPLGTCFAVGPRQFATAAHVTGPSDEGLVAIVTRTDNLSGYQDTTDERVIPIPLRIAEYDPLRDIAILELLVEGRNGFNYSLTGSDFVGTGTPVASLGYPHADHGRVVLTQQTSTVGARVLLGVGGLKIKHLVLNTQTRPGQSGGPVFTSDGRFVCAMIVGGYSPGGPSVSLGGIDPQTLHQTTHAVSAEYIQELIR